MREAFPTEFDGVRTLDEVVADLHALARGLLPHDTVVSIMLHTGQGVLMVAATGPLTELTDHTGEDPDHSFAAGGLSLTFSVSEPPVLDRPISQASSHMRASFVVYPDLFRGATLSTVDGVDHFQLWIDMGEWQIMVTES